MREEEMYRRFEESLSENMKRLLRDFKNMCHTIKGEIVRSGRNIFSCILPKNEVFEVVAYVDGDRKVAGWINPRDFPEVVLFLEDYDIDEIYVETSGIVKESGGQLDTRGRKHYSIMLNPMDVSKIELVISESELMGRFVKLRFE